MPPPVPIAKRPLNARDKILAAAVALIRAKGYAATTVDDLCRAAGVTKGAFFHHFASKEALGVAAAQFWSQTTGAMFAAAPYHRPADPLDRVLAYIDFRTGMITGPAESFSCLAGTMVQEVFAASPDIRRACEASIFSHTGTLEADIQAALERYRVTGFTAASLAELTQVVLQGAFVLAKARGGPEVAAESLAHLKRYFRLLFESGKEQVDAE